MAAAKKSSTISFQEIIKRQVWKPLPAFVVLTGNAQFFRQQVEQRFVRELFENTETPSIRRIDASKSVDGLLATVLDELRTLSILSSDRLVLIDSADAFVAEYRNELEPHVRQGFSGGHLILHLDNALDLRTKFAKAVLEAGWAVECRQPFDRPPPWQSGTPPWMNDLSKWIVEWAATKKLEISLQLAYHLQQRVGTDLGVLDTQLEKLRVYLGAKNKVDLETVNAVTGEIREDSIFTLVETFIAKERSKSLGIAEKLFNNGYHPSSGTPVYDPVAITLLFIGACVSRLRPLRRAHAISATGGGPDQWLEFRLTTRPFIDRFRKELKNMPPNRIDRVFETLLRIDRGLKSGADARTALTLVLAEA